MIDDDMRGFSILVSSLVVLIPALVGASMILVGVRRWLRARRLTAHGVPATAVVVDNQQESLSEGRIRFLPVVRFRTTTGQEISTVLEDLAGHRSHLAGTEHPVIYDADDPQRAVVPGARSGRLVGALVVGLVFLGFAAVAYRIIGPVLTGQDPFGTP
jgi:hypothetical protein